VGDYKPDALELKHDDHFRRSLHQQLSAAVRGFERLAEFMNMNDVWHRTKIEPKGNTMKSIMTALNPFETFLRGLANWLLLGLTGMTACGANFQNLSFEAGPIYNNPLDYSAIYPDVLPNWTVRFGNTVQPGASCNNFTLDYPVVALMSQGGFLGTNYVIAGNRSVYLQSSASLGDPLSAINVSISQVGGVPADAQSLVFDARNQWYSSFPIPPGLFNVTMDGVAVPLIPLTSDGGNVTYAANIANWSVQTTELSIGVLASSAWGGANWEGWSVVDSIRFSPESVPEPTIVALVGLSWVLLGLWRTKGKVQQGAS
jgi:hypothetical protein